jgi:Ni/Co efflux regulator RcnB
MRKLWLLGLAASAAMVPMATAQTVPDPEPNYGLPGISLKLPNAPALAAARTPARSAAASAVATQAASSVVARTAPPPVVYVAPRVVAPPPPMTPMHHDMRPAAAPPQVLMVRRQPEMRDAPPPQVREVQVRRMEMRGAPPARDMHRMDMRREGPRHGWTRIDRGGVVPGFWAGPQFMIRDWGSYGFARPFDGGRWIRYYDDALLVDRQGRVRDGRYGYDWSRYRDRWADRDGVPVYVGDGDYEPRDRDYDWAESWDRGDVDYGDMRRGDGCRAGPCGGPPPPPAASYGYGYSYGAPCACGPVVVTETVTTTAPVYETVTTYEYVTERVAPRRHYSRPVRRAPVRRAAPAPRPGERG